LFKVIQLPESLALNNCIYLREINANPPHQASLTFHLAFLISHLIGINPFSSVFGIGIEKDNLINRKMNDKYKVQMLSDCFHIVEVICICRVYGNNTDWKGRGRIKTC